MGYWSEVHAMQQQVEEHMMPTQADMEEAFEVQLARDCAEAIIRDPRFMLMVEKELRRLRNGHS